MRNNKNLLRKTRMFEDINTDIKLDLPEINSNNVYEIDREFLLL